MSQLEPIYRYDAKGKLIYSRDSNGFETWSKYDANGNEIHYKDSDGVECWYEFDAKGNLIHYRHSNGFDEWYYEGEWTKDPIKILLLQHNLRQNAISIS